MDLHVWVPLLSDLCSKRKLLGGQGIIREDAMAGTRDCIHEKCLHFLTLLLRLKHSNLLVEDEQISESNST